MTLRAAALILAFVAALSGPRSGAALQEVRVDGEWELVTKAPQNEVVWKVVFKQTGEEPGVQKLEVTMTGPQGRESKGSGSLRGVEIEWTISRRTSRGETTLVYTGTVAGDTMAGEVSLGRLKSFPWEAKRKPA